MLQIQGCNGLEPLSRVSGRLVQRPQKRSVGKDSDSISGKKSKEAATLHALAEKGRRKRINEHLETLRELFPELAKKQKASVLMEAVKRLRELRRKVMDHIALEQDQDGCCSGSKGGSSLFLPGERDEVKVSYCGGGDEGKMATATICCEDRQSLNADLTEAVQSVKGKLVKAEMATIGGRTKAVLVVQWCKKGGGVGEDDVGSLRMALKAVVEGRPLSCPVLLGSSLLNSRWAYLGPSPTTTCGSLAAGRPIVENSI